MKKIFEDMLQCPKCHGQLQWNICEESESRIINAEVTCSQCGAKYEVKDEIGIFLTPDLQRNDYWEQGKGGLHEYLDSEPLKKEEFLSTDEDKLSPGDYWGKLFYIEEEKNYKKAHEMYRMALKKIYTTELMEAWDSQQTYVLKQLKGTTAPIVDIASGRAYFAELLLKNLPNEIMATDFSPTVLMRDKQYFQVNGMYDKLSLVAFDARRTPFKDNSVEYMTSNVGISNIENAGDVVKELHRICGKMFMPIMIFFKEQDTVHIDFMKKAGMESLATEKNALSYFSSQPWNCSVENSIDAHVKPTPTGVILDVLKIDGLPLEDTVDEYCVLKCTK
ncbi:Methyltransferase domain-containing protein [Hathewaya proteolytica DSM 3090]|uniref:Methyltransferase domain-containing protein n=1 Tax=Hathewaya proteolytica DSM 3090 TaxID=1121331 RepID=A0A1M6TCZ7_9CLOT|nr:methyltransferase domain-containing protein [Hathewaya proteolytica]SHK54744.1 Methyltransferase domain-containing protein [Hathewaya proteolytica DSM 3090]